MFPEFYNRYTTWTWLRSQHPVVRISKYHLLTSCRPFENTDRPVNPTRLHIMLAGQSFYLSDYNPTSQIADIISATSTRQSASLAFFLRLVSTDTTTAPNQLRRRLRLFTNSPSRFQWETVVGENGASFPASAVLHSKTLKLNQWGSDWRYFVICSTKPAMAGVCTR